MSVHDRLEFVKTKRLCFNCLHGNHNSSKCKRNSLCKTCIKKHNDLLHYEAPVPPEKSSPPAASVSNESTYCVSRSACAGISCVEVLIEGRDALYKCKAIVDSKSSTNLCTEKLANKLKLPSVPFKTTLNVATGSYCVEGKKLLETKVYSRDMKQSAGIKNVLTIKSIPISMDSIFVPNDLKGYDELKDVQIPTCDNSDEIDLLIGSGVPKAFYQYDTRIVQSGDLYAVNQTFGWEIVGKKRVDNHNSQFSKSINMVNSAESVFFVSNPVDDIDRVFRHEFMDCNVFSDKLCPSIEDKEAVRLVEASLKLENSQFEVGIPWKKDPAKLPESKCIVMKRLNYLKTKMSKDSELKKAYSNEMKKFIDNGFLELSSCPTNDTEYCHYIPHHPVFHPRKGSFRIVWDCALSLNDYIYEGPDLMNSLVEVLIRFRRFKYVICSDIQKMYLNVKIPHCDRGALRILWWPEGDFSVEPVEYRATVHIYGAKSSGFVANYCVKYLAEKVSNAAISDVILHDFYVDDQISSFQSESDAVEFVKEIPNVLKSGRFHLTKFVSNSCAVMNCVPDNDQAKTIDLILGESKYKYLTLVVKWSDQEDILGFPCSLPSENEVPTRRYLFSLIARVYDPGILHWYILILMV